MPCILTDVSTLGNALGIEKSGLQITQIGKPTTSRTSHTRYSRSKISSQKEILSIECNAV